MKRIVPILLIISLFVVSCGTSRFTFDRTEKNITELGGTYNKEVGEEITKIYKNGGIEEVIDTVYQTDYLGGDPYVVVEGYLGEEAYEEFKKVIKELKLEIEDLRKGVNLEKNEIGGNEGLALAVLNETYPEGLVIETLGGMDKKNTQDFKSLLDEKIALRDELRTILDELGIEGIKDALVNGEYTEEEIETYLGKSTLDDAKLMFAKETGTDGFVPVAKDSNSGAMEFVAHTDSEETKAKNEEMPVVNYIVIVLIVVALVYVFAAIARSSYRRPLAPVVSLISVGIITVVAICATTVIFGWSPYWLGFLISLPSYFILTIETRN
ncbi:MAG: hypothetical protein ACI3ZD_16425 [Prevotella sp.]